MSLLRKFINNVFYYIMVRILSWDVGVINLAYCYMTKTKDGYKIYDWQKINLMEDEQRTCINKGCSKNAVWSCDNKF